VPLDIELTGSLTLGMTVSDFRSTPPDDCTTRMRPRTSRSYEVPGASVDAYSSAIPRNSPSRSPHSSSRFFTATATVRRSGGWWEKQVVSGNQEGRSRNASHVLSPGAARHQDASERVDPQTHLVR
jgi:hypothetical protein